MKTRLTLSGLCLLWSVFLEGKTVAGWCSKADEGRSKECSAMEVLVVRLSLFALL